MSLSLFANDPFHTLFGGYYPHSIMSYPRTAHGTMSRSPHFTETDEKYSVSFETPGLGPGDINVEFHDDNYLTVSGSRNDSTDDSRSRYSFSQTVRLPRNSDTNNISARVDRGILSVDVAKIPRPDTVSIPVTGSEQNYTDNVGVSHNHAPRV